MAFIKIKDWKGQNLNKYKVKKVADTEDIYQVDWLPLTSNVEQRGTTLNEEIWNELQKGIPQLLTNQTIPYSNNKYFVYLEGLKDKNDQLKDGLNIFEGLEVKVKISQTNNENNPMMILNNYEFPIKKIDADGVDVNVERGELLANVYYNFMYYNNSMICRELSLLNANVINKIIDMITQEINPDINKLAQTKKGFETTLIELKQRVSNVLDRLPSLDKIYLKNEIDTRLLELDNKLNINGDNIENSNLFRENISVFSKEETLKEIMKNKEISEATEMQKGTLTLKTVKDISKKTFEENILYASDNVDGIISKNKIKSLIKETTDEIKVLGFIELMKGSVK